MGAICVLGNFVVDNSFYAEKLPSKGQTLFGTGKPPTHPAYLSNPYPDISLSLLCFPYAEIRDNILDADMRPVDLLRFKLAFFGASKFDPKSELWTRITLFQGAPLPHELSTKDTDEWAFPVMPT